MNTRYIARTSDSWLRVQITNGPIISVPYGLKVNFKEARGGREHFVILEGNYKGKHASVQAHQGHSYLTPSLRHGPPAIVKFDRRKQTILVNGRGPYNAFSGGGHSGFTPVAPGTYSLAIPAYPSAQTRSAYGRWTRYHNMWFRIGTSTAGSRFLHAGAISEGCVTVRQFLYDPASRVPPPAGFGDLVGLASSAPGLIGVPLPAVRVRCVGWDQIVDALILSRLNDQAVGKLVVT